MGWVFGRFSTVLHPKATSKLLNHSLGHGPGPRWGTSSILDFTVPLTQDLIRISWITQKRSTKLKIDYQKPINCLPQKRSTKSKLSIHNRYNSSVGNASSQGGPVCSKIAALRRIQPPTSSSNIIYEVLGAKLSIISALCMHFSYQQ